MALVSGGPGGGVHAGQLASQGLQRGPVARLQMHLQLAQLWEQAHGWSGLKGCMPAVGGCAGPAGLETSHACHGGRNIAVTAEAPAAA